MPGVGIFNYMSLLNAMRSNYWMVGKKSNLNYDDENIVQE